MSGLEISGALLNQVFRLHSSLDDRQIGLERFFPLPSGRMFEARRRCPARFGKLRAGTAADSRNKPPFRMEARLLHVSQLPGCGFMATSLAPFAIPLTSVAGILQREAHPADRIGHPRPRPGDFEYPADHTRRHRDWRSGRDCAAGAASRRTERKARAGPLHHREPERRVSQRPRALRNPLALIPGEA